MLPVQRRRPSRVVTVLGLLLLAGGAKPYARTVHATPTRVGGVDFQAATQDEWSVHNAPAGQDRVDIRLVIGNRGDRPVLFPTFDTFKLSLHRADGEAVPTSGGRDGTLRGVLPVLVSPGETYSLCREARLEWIDQGRARRLVYLDGTGSVFTFGPLAAGAYTLRFRYCNAEESTVDGYSAWTGEAQTAPVEFTLVD